MAVRDWLPDLPPLAEPEPGELARRYLGGYGPAGHDDLAMWWGLPLGQARTEWEALGDEAAKVTFGAWDAYLLGHADRSLILDPRHGRRVNRGGGWLHPVVLVDGRVAGIWRTERKARRLRVTVEPFTSISRQALAGIHQEAEDIGRFLELAFDLHVHRT